MCRLLFKIAAVAMETAKMLKNWKTQKLVDRKGESLYSPVPIAYVSDKYDVFRIVEGSDFFVTR